MNTLKAENKELAKKIKYLEGVLREGRRTEIEKEQFGRDVSIHIEAYRDREAKIEYKRAKRMVPKEGGLLEDIYDKHSVRRAELERQKNEKQLQLQVVRLNIEKEKMSTLVQQDAEAGTAVAFEARIDAINTRIAEIEAEIKTLNEKWQSYSTKIHTVGEICIPFLQATHQMADNRDLGQYLGAQALNTLLMAPLVSPDFQIDVPESHGALWAAWTGLLISLAPIRGEFRKICDEWVGPDSNLDVLSLMLTYNRIDSHVLTTSRIASAIPKILDRMIGELNVPGKIEQLNLQGITASVDGLKTMNTFNEQVTTLRLFSEIMDCSVTFLDRDHLHRTAFIRDRHGRPAIHIEVKDGRIYAVLPHIIRTEFNHLRTDFEASAYGAAAKAADTARQISVEPILSRLSGSEKISSDQLGRLFKTTAALNSVKTAETLQDIEWISHELVEMAKASHRLVYLPPESTMNLENFGVAIRGIPHTPSESGQWILAPVHIGHLDFYTTDTASEPSVSEAIRTYAILHALKHPLQGSGAIRCKDGVVTISFLTEGNTLLIQKSART
ncbi:hypothetical protein EBR96_05805 [bacterium]|nr:hypothetical protein [bacterium]